MPFSTTTRSNLVTRIRERLFNTFWTDAELQLYINEALRVWNALTGQATRSDTTRTVSTNTIFLDWTTDDNTTMAVLRLGAANVHLEPVTLADLDNIKPDWQSEAAGTTQFFAPIGLNQMAFSPKPSASLSLNIDFLVEITVPTGDTSNIQVPEEDINALIDYVSFVSALKEGGAELQAAVPKLQTFLAHAAKRNSRLNSVAPLRKILGLPDVGQAELRPSSNMNLTPRASNPQR